MKATAWEFRYRLWLSFAIIVLGFAAPWIEWLQWGNRETHTWGWLASQLGRLGIASVASFELIAFMAIGAAAMAAALRVWGTAYLGTFTVFHAEMKAGAEQQAGEVMAAGPYRYLRNPLYMGSYLTIVALAILMRSGIHADLAGDFSGAPDSGRGGLPGFAPGRAVRRVLPRGAALAAQPADPGCRERPDAAMGHCLPGRNLSHRSRAQLCRPELAIQSAASYPGGIGQLWPFPGDSSYDTAQAAGGHCCAKEVGFLILLSLRLSRCLRDGFSPPIGCGWIALGQFFRELQARM